METVVELITPERAELYLRSNTANRPLRKTLVSQYAADMAKGHWLLTHQGLAFTHDGLLLDGQHRLKAIVESGRSVHMTVTRGVSDRCQLVMDDHAKRTAGDALSLARKERITQNHVAVIRAAIELGSTSRSIRMTKQDLDEAIDQCSRAYAFVSTFGQNHQRGVTSASVQGAILLAWYYVADLGRLEQFCDVLSGAALPEDGGDRAAVMLREWLLRTGVQSATSRKEAFKKTQRAIVAFMDRNNINKLYGTVVYFPWPLEDPVRT